MSRIVNEFHIDKYLVLTIDEMPKHLYEKVSINGTIFSLVPVFDAQNTIAIESKEDFAGSTIEFI